MCIYAYLLCGYTTHLVNRDNCLLGFLKTLNKLYCLIFCDIKLSILWKNRCFRLQIEVCISLKNVFDFLKYPVYHCIKLMNLKMLQIFRCLNFWDEAGWFSSFRFFRLLSSSLLLYSQRFSWYVRSSSGVCRTQKPTQNFEPHPLFYSQGLFVLIPLTITGYKC